MTSLHLQKLIIEDCELAIEKGFYKWGQETGKNRSDPTTNDPDWEDASPELRDFISHRGYNLFEGFPIPQDDEISVLEVYASIGVNSFARVNDAVRYLAHSVEAHRLLARIPEEALLENGGEELIIVAAELINLFRGKYQIELAKTTKFLYKKRPKFIPMIDSVVNCFLQQNFPYYLDETLPTERVLYLFRELLVAEAQPLEQIKAALDTKGFILSKARILSYLIWLTWKDSAKNIDSSKRMRESIIKLWETESLPETQERALQSWIDQKALLESASHQVEAISIAEKSAQ